MPKIIKKWLTTYYEFQLCQDTIHKILKFPIYINIRKEERNIRDKAVRDNFCKDEPNKEIMRDIAESFDCWWISIEHLTAIRNYISLQDEYTKILTTK